jgi:dTDP-4-amino-4,6-dideoxygalactose transaminase
LTIPNTWKPGKIGNKKVGTFGDAAMFSYCQNKIITTGEGGAIVTDSKEMYEKLKLIRSHGRPDNSDYFSSTAVFDYITLGFNLRMSNLLAALGVSQLEMIDKIISKRRSNAAYYEKKLSKISGINIPKNPSDAFNVYQLFSIRVKKRDSLMKHLADCGIMTKIYFSPVHLTYFYRNVLKYTCKLPVTMKISKDIISLPFYPGIKRAEQDQVVESIKRYYAGD